MLPSADKYTNACYQPIVQLQIVPDEKLLDIVRRKQQKVGAQTLNKQFSLSGTLCDFHSAHSERYFRVVLDVIRTACPGRLPRHDRFFTLFMSSLFLHRSNTDYDTDDFSLCLLMKFKYLPTFFILYCIVIIWWFYFIYYLYLLIIYLLINHSLKKMVGNSECFCILQYNSYWQ